MKDKDYFNLFMKKYVSAGDKNSFIDLGNVDRNLKRLSSPELDYRELIGAIVEGNEGQILYRNDIRPGLKGKVMYDFTKSPLD